MGGRAIPIWFSSVTDEKEVTGRTTWLCEQIARLGGLKLVPGMPVETFVQTGERTVMSYLVKPLSDQIMKAFRER